MTTDCENTVNTKTTELHLGPTADEMRLSRVSHPRATLMAIILLAAVFLLFGMFASAAQPDYAPALGGSAGSTTLLGSWVGQHLGRF